MRRRAQLRGKGLWEETCNHHESNKADWTAFAKVVAGTHQSVLWCFPCHIPASLGQVGCDRPGPPAHVKWKEWWWKTLCPGLDTHTHTPSSMPVTTVVSTSLRSPIDRSTQALEDETRPLATGEWCGEARQMRQMAQRGAPDGLTPPNHQTDPTSTCC